MAVVAKEDRPPTLEQLMKDGVIVTGDDESLLLKKVPTGIPQLDNLLEGGFPVQRNTLIVGPESTGKTLLAQYAIAGVQREGRAAMLIDTEYSYTKDWWAKSGVETDKLFVARPGTGEQAIDTMRAGFLEPTVGIVVLDSIAAMVPSPELTKSAEAGQTFAPLAHLTGKLFHVAMGTNKDAVFIAINQVRDSPDPYAEETYPGGRAQRFYAHLRLRTRRVEWIKDKDARVGFVMSVTAQKNKTAEPFGACEIPIRFRGQIDVVASYIDEAIMRGLIKAGGAWYTWRDTRVLGKALLRDHFTSRPEDFAELRGELEAIGST